MEQLKEILSNPIYYIVAMTILGVIQIIPSKIVKAQPVTWIGMQIGKFFNGCDIKKELFNNNQQTNNKIDILDSKIEHTNMKIDWNDIDAVRNRIVGNDMLIKKGEKLEYYQKQNALKDIDKWRKYHEIYKELNGEVNIAVDNIIDYCKKDK